jgi:hypothetical protein
MNALVGLSNNISANINKITVWGKSFKKYVSGNIYLLCANANPNELEMVSNLGINAIPVTVDDTWYINHKRLSHVKDFLERAQEDKFLITDVFDVAFQADPFVKMHTDCDIFISEEGVTVNEEPWNADNIFKLFPDQIDKCMHNQVVCSGIIGGYKQPLIKLYDKMFSLCEVSTNDHNIKDQAALMVLLANQEVHRVKQFTLNDAWTVHCAVAGPTNFFEGWGFKQCLIRKGLHIPYLENNIIKTNGVAFDMIHQFNRIPEWNSAICGLYI